MYVKICCPLKGYSPIAVPHRPVVISHQRVGSTYGKLFNYINSFNGAPLSGYRFGLYPIQQEIPGWKKFVGTVITPRDNSHLKASTSLAQNHLRRHNRSPAVNGRVVPGYGNGLISVNRA